MKFLSLQWSLFLALNLFSMTIPVQCMDTNEPAADTQKLFLLKEITLDNIGAQIYRIHLYRKGIKDNIIGYAEVTIIKETNNAYLELLHIISRERQKSYGSILFNAVLKDIHDQSCTKIKWCVSPIDLRDNESRTEMLPKLINFYKRNGAVIDQDSRSPYNMIYKFYPHQHIAQPQYQGKNIIMSRL